MSAHFTIHNCRNMIAKTGRTSGAPLTIELWGDESTCPHSITIYTDDFVLTDRLIEAINSTMRQRQDEVADTEATEEDM